jgi:hypothetical protein
MRFGKGAGRTRLIGRRLHFICKAHLDPVWLWEWQEGLGEALSTFREFDPLIQLIFEIPDGGREQA